MRCIISTDMRFKFINLALIFGVLFFSMVASVVAAEDTAKPPSEEPEYIKQIEEEFGVVTDPVLNARVGAIRDRLLAVIPQAKTDKRTIVVKVLDDPMVNAFATPDGHVYFFKGLVDECDTDDMLAAVMAHELTHVFHKHHSRMSERQLQGMLIGIAAAAVSKQMEAVILGQMLAASMVETYGRSAEIDADKSGTIFLLDAGFDPLASLELIQVLEQESIHSPQAGGNYFTVHPDPDARMAIIRDTLIEHGIKVPDEVYRVHLPILLVLPLTGEESAQLSQWESELKVVKPEEKHKPEHGLKEIEEKPEESESDIPPAMLSDYQLRQKLFKGISIPADRAVGVIVVDEEPVFYLSEKTNDDLTARGDAIIKSLGTLFLEGMRSYDVEEGTTDGLPSVLGRKIFIASTYADEAALTGKSQAEANKARADKLENILWRYYVSRRI
jgi:Zn-dependent protease with chaperone function